MELKNKVHTRSKPDIARQTARRWIHIAVGLAVTTCLLAGAFWWVSSSQYAMQRGPNSNTTPGPGNGLTTAETTSPDSASQDTNLVVSPTPQPEPAAELVSAPQATPEARKLVAGLVHLEIVDSALTREQAAAWKQNLQDLVAQGTTGAAAIREFLTQNREFNFGAGARELLGYGSARTALFGALVQMGGPEAVNAMTEVLQITADPREIALIAQNLQKLEPDQHLEEILDAARQTLQMAGAQKLELSDVAPLFEVLDKYGGAAVAADLAQAATHWNYYGTIALAQLPDDAGVPILVQLAQDPKTSTSLREATVQMLAQVSDHSPDARATLLNLARLDKISLFTWQMVISSLAGDQVGLLNSAFEDHSALAQTSGLRTVATSDKQNFFALPGNLTPEQTNQRLALIDDLLAGTGDPQVRQLLHQASNSLRNRLSQLAFSGQ
jgi:hypothetical protein